MSWASALRWLSVPLLTAAVPASFAVWAFPEAISPIRTAAILVGWVGCGLLLVSLMLMLREARLAYWLGGLERIYRWHHHTGIAAYLLLLAHPLLLATNGLADSPALAWQTLAPMHESWPVWSGWLALLLLMLGLGVTFTHRIPYHAWRWLHAGLGGAVLIGLYHLVLLGIDEPVLPILVVASLILGWRIIRADWGLSARPYIVASVRRIAEGTVEIALRPLAAPLGAVPGQYVLVAFSDGPTFRGCGEFHPFSISSVERDHSLRIGVKALGDCTRRMQSMEAGVAARVQGSFGRFSVDEQPAAASLFWVAGGVGVTPFVAMLRSGRVTRPTTLIYIFRSENDAAFLPELRTIVSSDPLLSLRTFATGDMLPDLEQVVPGARELSGCECYLCGPPGLIAGLKATLRDRGVASNHIHFESFDFR
jgi:predicted ferric reductase